MTKNQIPVVMGIWFFAIKVMEDETEIMKDKVSSLLDKLKNKK